MASLSYDNQKQRWRIQFKAPDGTRRSIGLKASRKAESRAQTLRGRVEELLQAALTCTAIPGSLARWVADLPDETHKQLSDAGLIEARASSLLGPFLDDWMKQREREKKSTLTTWAHTRRNLLAFFGPDKPLREITEADAAQFSRWLKTNQELAESTARKRCSITKQFFSSAVDARLLEISPFRKVKGSQQPNRQRQFFVTEEVSQRVLAACPDAEFRLLFGLARWCALRTPSEPFALRWQDVNWEQGVLHIHASKTAHHKHGGERVVPIFPEVLPLLREVWEQAPEGAVHVIEHYRQHTNLGVKLSRVVRQAGLAPWPKVWHNLRATRCTELQQGGFAPQVVTDWCGHTEAIAEQAYWMTTAEDFARAAEFKATTITAGGANVVQQAIANGGNGLQAQSGTNEKTPVFPGFASTCDNLQGVQMGDTGPERNPGAVVKTLAPGAAAAPGGAYVVHSAQGGADWQTIRGLIEACTELPAATRKRLIALGDKGAG